MGFFRIQTSDPSEFETALEPWELLCRPSTASAFSHSLEMLQGPGFLIYRESFAQAAKVVGITPPGMIGVAVPIGYGQETRYWGIAHGPKSIPMTTPGPLDVALHSGHEQLVAFASETTLEHLLSDREFSVLQGIALQRHADIGARQLNTLANWLATTIATFRSKPSLANSNMFMETVLEELVDQFRSIAQVLLPSKRPDRTVTSRRLGLTRALEYLRDRKCSNPSMASLCQVSGLSERSLQVAFQESIGLSPRQFMNLRRLHLVRRDLLNAGRKTRTVAEVAMEHGFCELGRFAGKYRERFGELPSQTLLRERW